MKKLFWLILALGLGACASPSLQTAVVNIPTKTPLPADTPTQIPTVGDTATLTLAPTLTPTLTETPTPTSTLTPSPESLVAVVLAAGDIANCNSYGDGATATLIENLPGSVLTLGDNAYLDGTAQQFADCYAPTWGKFKDRTYPAPGNHDYNTPGAAGYFNYFGAVAGDPVQGYYSFDLGAWHLIALNSNCTAIGGCAAGSPQEQWLRADLAAHPTACTLAYWHHPLFNAGLHGDDDRTRALWQALYDADADLILTGHDHNYQRFAPLDPSGQPDSSRGLRQFVVGTGGSSLYPVFPGNPNLESYAVSTFGVLRLGLRSNGYDWNFISEAGKPFTDLGSGSCH